MDFINFWYLNDRAATRFNKQVKDFRSQNWLQILVLVPLTSYMALRQLIRLLDPQFSSM